MSLKKLTNFGGIGVNAEERVKSKNLRARLHRLRRLLIGSMQELSNFAPSSPSKLQASIFSKPL